MITLLLVQYWQYGKKRMDVYRLSVIVIACIIVLSMGDIMYANSNKNLQYHYYYYCTSLCSVPLLLLSRIARLTGALINFAVVIAHAVEGLSTSEWNMFNGISDKSGNSFSFLYRYSYKYLKFLMQYIISW